MSKLDLLCNFILDSDNEMEFHLRFNYLISSVMKTFEIEYSNSKKLPFFSHQIIDKYNNKLNEIIDKINEKEFEFFDGLFIHNLFLIMLEMDYPLEFNNYQLQTFHINN